MSEPKSKIKDVTERGTTAHLLQAHLRANNDSQSWVQTPQIPSTAVGEELTPQSLRGQTVEITEKIVRTAGMECKYLLSTYHTQEQ